ncbi:MAG: molybdopterin-dependent oxidoreductase, partial [Prolixibacteraceae bacterium]|nr:molybdopterin-dependent oxidoreductase [Prolixibacteraceae bacterium]
MANRRDFIKVSALTTGGVLLAGGYAKKAFAADDNKAYNVASDLQRTPTYCEVCFWKCAGWVHKNEDGQIQKIIGNDDDPACNGRFCPRGTGGVGMYYDEDRLKNPMMRVTGDDGKQTFKEVSWDEALDFVARKMQRIKKEYGPECTALLTHGSGGSYFGKVLKAFGSNNIAAPSYAQCRGPREVAFISTFGEGLNSPEPTDIRDTKCLVLIGSHLGENMHNGQVQEMSDAIDRGATIITVDPRFSTAASKSTFWLPIKPSTDLALLLTWINLIIENNWYDKEYVEKYTYGFDILKAEVKKYTPEWAYGVTTIKPEDIRKTAKEMHDASPAVIIHPGRHVTWYGDDTQRLRAVAILNTLLGSWGRRGGFYRTEKKSVKHYPTPPNPKPSRTWREAMGGKYELADLALANGVCDATIPSATMDCHIKAWIVNGTNLIKTLPDKRQTLKAIQALELMVVVDTMPMEITGYADVILPECTYLERYDSIRSLQGRQGSVALRMPAVEAKYNTKSAWWMAKELANKMNLSEYFPFDTQ